MEPQLCCLAFGVSRLALLNGRRHRRMPYNFG